MDTIWESIPKPVGRESSKLADFFEVRYFGLSHYEMLEEQFHNDVSDLREKFAAPR
jgi:hypothetical protein